LTGNGFCECTNGFEGKSCNITSAPISIVLPPGAIGGIVVLIIIVVAGGVVAFIVWWKFFRNATIMDEAELHQEKSKHEHSGQEQSHQSDFDSGDVSFVEE